MAVILLLCLLIFRKGKGAAHAEAQAWAQSTVDVALEVYNAATAKAEAISEAYSLALSQANATAQNSVVFQLPEQYLSGIEQKEPVTVKAELENPLILPESLIQEVVERSDNARRDEQSSRVAMGEQLAQELTALRKATDTQTRSSTPF